MSEKASVEHLPARALVDADVFFSYLVADQLSGCSEKLVYRADSGLLKLQVASEIYDDIITALRSTKTPIEVVEELLSDLRRIPHEVLPTSVETAAEAKNRQEIY